MEDRPLEYHSADTPSPLSAAAFRLPSPEAGVPTVPPRGPGGASYHLLSFVLPVTT